MRARTCTSAESWCSIRPGGRPPTREQLHDHLASRLGELPRYRQRLSEPHTGGLSWPRWEADPAFDLHRHITRAALPAPGGPEQLAEWSSEFFSSRLDRHRPLWEMAIIEGLADGRWALAHKTHHCMVDGVGRWMLPTCCWTSSRTLGTRPRSGPSAAASSAASAGPATPAQAAGDGRARLAAEVRRGPAGRGDDRARGAVRRSRGASPARGARQGAFRGRADPARGAARRSDEPNDPIGTRRRFEVVSVPLADLKSIRRALGGTVNDVVLTLTASGLRALLVSRGEPLPEQGMRAMVPMNVRDAASTSPSATASPRCSWTCRCARPISCALPRDRRTLRGVEVRRTGGGKDRRPRDREPGAARAPLGARPRAVRDEAVQPHDHEHPRQAVDAVRVRRSAARGPPLAPLAAAHAIGVAALATTGRCSSAWSRYPTGCPTSTSSSAP